MGKFADFLKTTVIGSFFVLLPIVVVIGLIILAVVTVIEVTFICQMADFECASSRYDECPKPENR